MTETDRRGGGRRIGALVRTHLAQSGHVLALAGQIRDAGFDPVCIAADETQGPVEAGGFAKLSHDLRGLGALGLRIPPRALWFCGDYAYYATVLGRDDADFWLMVEHDVALRDPASGYWRALHRALRDVPGPLPDMVASHFGPYRRTHFRSAHAEPLKIFFALTGLSPRAVEALYRARLREAAEGAPDPRGTHCEIFVPSELAAAGGFRCLDLNALLPGSVDGRGFSPQRIVPVGHEARMPGGGALVHRVAEMPEYLARGPTIAARYGWVEQFAREVEEFAAPGTPREAREAAADLARREVLRLAHAARRVAT
ncbi:hypothetical protein [Falsiroseomonas sp. CW058]|uniref:hypothetical protein n=1 Tax=Falsiroseomonas sp. CW058 TaxID=3388664 RepID=UPI003D32422A